MSLRAKRGNLVAFMGVRRNCFVVPLRNDNLYANLINQIQYRFIILIHRLAHCHFAGFG